MKIEVSIGEIADKYTILTIKSFEILDEEKQANIKIAKKKGTMPLSELSEPPSFTTEE